MDIHDHADEFGGLPVAHLPAPTRRKATRAENAAARADARREPPEPDQVAWALRTVVWGREAEEFPHLFGRFLDTVDTTRVTAVVIGQWGDSGTTADVPIGLLCDAADRFPSLRHLYVGDITPEECEISWIQQGDVTPLLAAFPALETLVVQGSHARLDPVGHTALRHLEFVGSGLSGRVLQSLAASQFPELHTLDVWFGPEDYGCTATVEDAEALLRSNRGLPSLSRLGLRNCEFADELAALLAGAPIVARLRELDLSLGTFGDEGAEALLSGQPLGHLSALNLEHNFISEAVAERLRTDLAGVEVITKDRNVGGQWGRYVAVSE
ncbi:MAG TPA: STM4015 family protein [Yinghuangia sp.]|uniref:STM4015 family protein n=1 Tax=Yinghuangia sp. YIM S10712 TaxID=3436930 RepID=UPI002CE307FD|nr:STM4015 family protein [Yinghuangia sp.]